MLREPVIVKTAWNGQELKGELFVGADGLPQLSIECGEHNPYSEPVAIPYRPWTLPAAWRLDFAHGQREKGLLLESWEQIENIQRQLVVAQHEAEEAAKHDTEP